VSMADIGRSSQLDFSSPIASGLVMGRQGQSGASTADLGRSSQPKFLSPSASELVMGLSPVLVTAPLPSCSNPVALSQGDIVEPSLPLSFPPLLVV
jgi:hypothetical protein